MKADETVQLGRDRAIDHGAVERIDSVQNEVLEPGLSCSLHAQAHRGRVGVKSAADILHVEHQCIQPLELLGRGFARFAIKAVNGKAGFFVSAVRHCFINNATNAVLGTEQGHQRHARRILQQVNCRLAVPVVTRVIRDEADAFAFERCKLVLCQHVNAIEDLCLAEG